jgi:hypothetical protein
MKRIKIFLLTFVPIFLSGTVFAQFKNASEITPEELMSVREMHTSNHTVYCGSDARYHYFKHARLFSFYKKYKIGRGLASVAGEFPVSAGQAPELFFMTKTEVFPIPNYKAPRREYLCESWKDEETGSAMAFFSNGAYAFSETDKKTKKEITGNGSYFYNPATAELFIECYVQGYVYGAGPLPFYKRYFQIKEKNKDSVSVSRAQDGTKIWKSGGKDGCYLNMPAEALQEKTYLRETKGIPFNVKELLANLNAWDKTETDAYENPGKYTDYAVSGETGGWIEEHKKLLKKLGREAVWNNEKNGYELK